MLCVYVVIYTYIPFIYPLGKDILTFKNFHHISLLGHKIGMYLFNKNENKCSHSEIFKIL